jgi:predicted DsbA family dithiol-disulfide isomerase
LEKRYGAGFAAQRREMFEEAGLPHAEKLDKVPNSRRALMLGELARERGVFEEVHRRLFDAYWAHGLDIGDEQVLMAEGVAVGLGEADIVDALRDGRYLELIEAQTHAAMEIGAGGVPAWVIDRRLLVPGAQPHEVFARVLERLGHAPLE